VKRGYPARVCLNLLEWVSNQLGRDAEFVLRMESLPPDLLDELARVYARAAAEAFIAGRREDEPEGRTNQSTDKSPSKSVSNPPSDDDRRP
jgi:hypothetical protein